MKIVNTKLLVLRPVLELKTLDLVNAMSQMIQKLTSLE